MFKKKTHVECKIMLITGRKLSDEILLFYPTYFKNSFKLWTISWIKDVQFCKNNLFITLGSIFNR